jgi:hypothetical protein
MALPLHTCRRRLRTVEVWQPKSTCLQQQQQQKQQRLDLLWQGGAGGRRHQLVAGEAVAHQSSGVGLRGCRVCRLHLVLPKNKAIMPQNTTKQANPAENIVADSKNTH